MATDGIPVVTVAAGGLPVSIAPEGYGIPVTESPIGMGLAITVVAGAGGGGMAISYAGVATLTLGGETDGGSITVADNIAVNGFIGTLAVIGGTGTYTFTETSDPDNKFTVSGSTLRTSALLNWATDASHPVTIQADNGAGSTASASFTILVTDFVAPVSSITSTPNTLDNTPTFDFYFTTTGSNPTLVGDVLRIYKDGVVIVNATLDASYLASGFSITLGPYADGVYVFASRIYRPASTTLSTQFPAAGITLTIDVYATNTVAPVVSGSMPYDVGTVLSCTTGTWAATPVVTGYNYQWKRGGTNISGATTNSYTLVAADHNVNITCTVAGITAAGPSTAVASNTLATGTWAPVNTAAPAATGAPGIGTVLTCGTGTWTRSPSSYAYQWLRDGATISGATSSTYTTVVADDDTDVSCRVTATNTYGTSAPADSNAIAISGGGTTIVTAPNGMWWELDGSLTNGTYCNGDPWVFVTAAGADLIDHSTPTIGTGATVRHGSMINPTYNTYAQNTTLGVNTARMKQGYDGRLDDYVFNPTAPPTAFLYDATLNATATLPKTLHAGDSLVSCISASPSSPNFNYTNPKAFDRMACLTIVDHIPAATEFRPPYYGTSKPRYDFADADLGLLPDLTAFSPFNPKGGWSEGFNIDEGSVYSGQVDQMNMNSLRDLQYWISPVNINGTLVKAQLQQEPYPRDFGVAQGKLAMYVMCDFEDGDNIKFLKRLMQVGIDGYHVLLDNTLSAPFGGGAGFAYGPLWSIILTGLLLDITGMKNAASLMSVVEDYNGDPVSRWGYHNQCYLSTTAHAQYYRPPTEDYTAGFPLYGNRPNQAPFGGSVGTNISQEDPDHVFDMHDYKYSLEIRPEDIPVGGEIYPASEYPYILDTTYEVWNWLGAENIGAVAPQVDPNPTPRVWEGRYEAGGVGSYMLMTYAAQGDVLASIAMGEEARWGGAVVQFAKRIYWDAQMWTQWGHYRDYSDAYSAPKMYHRDIYGCGGTGSGWMLAMWEAVYGVSYAPTFGPTISSTVPADGATDAVATANLTVTFSENIQFGTGDINIYKSSDDTLFENFDVVTHAGTKLTISGAVLTINPAGTMAGSTGYYVQIDATAIESVDDDAPFAGILNETTWNFTTAAGETITTIFTMAMPLSNEGLETQSRRMFCNVTGGAGPTNQIRVTFKGHATLTGTIEFASIAISVAASETATATPVQLTSGGGSSGFTLTAGEEEASDWVTLGGFTASDLLMVTMDYGTTGANISYTSSNSDGCMYTTSQNVNNYNQITGTWTSWAGGLGVAVIKIETK